MQTSPLQKKYSIGEAAEFLGVSIDTLRRWEKSGKVVALRSPRGHRYFLKENLEKAFGQKYSRNTPPITEAIQPETIKTAYEPTQITPEAEITKEDVEQTIHFQTPAPPISSFQPTQAEINTNQAVINKEESFTPPEHTSQETTYPEKPDTIEENPYSSPNQASQIPEIPSPQSAESDTPDVTNLSTSDSIPDSQPQSGSFPSINQQEKPSRESLLPEVQQSKVIASTVNRQEQKGGPLKKVAIFLLIVFLMINIILIGFYIFVSRQL